MALMSTTNPSGLGTSTQYQKLINKKLLGYAVQQTVMDQVIQKSSFTRNAGAKTVRFLRPDAPGPTTNVSTLTEGTPLATYREWGYTSIEATLKQYGSLSRISDILNMTDLFSTLRQTTKLLAQDAALHADFLIMTELLDTTNTGSSTISTANNRYAQGISSYNNLVAATAAGGAVVIQDLLGAMTRLKLTRTPKKNGEYICIAPPHVTYDWMNDTKFVNAGVYGTTKGLFKGEAGMWYGTRIIETTTPWIEANTAGTIGTYSASGGIYTSLVLGSDSIGAAEMGGDSEFDPKIVILDKADKSDGLNQFISVGWKAYWAAVTLNNTWAVALRSKTTFV